MTTGPGPHTDPARDGKPKGVAHVTRVHRPRHRDRHNIVEAAIKHVRRTLEARLSVYKHVPANRTL
jgi:hypothetical protein